MRRLFVVSTVAFWLALAGFWSAPLWWPAEAAAPAAAVAAASRSVTLAELARHDRPQDCWMAIDRQVYDFSAYLPQHPADPAVMQAWCGKEASTAYHTKLRGRPHSSYADGLLPQYRIGSLATKP